ncbi:MAG TPA: DNA polymerase III subunit gamma and tau [Nocardioidaceae bacterium]|nr:DNA polymerase III subunit gamma and tau [Nocardioidaceae bacterium]
MNAPLALYRRYRPDTFGDVIGQEQVTEPLSNALDNNRAHHAYLFSGPRGCGKTTCARILARALNCAEGPTSTPCGECDSCRELATGGPGSIDVIEIDAASHGGVDDARDLRERAVFSPVKSRYKVYIVDEAHMVSSHGFNALLKLVEEPPEHVRFVFATTEPEKVLATIKSRTHHYPFRLVPPKLLGDYVLTLCEREGVAIEPVAVPLVVRAGAGSVRDTLSVLDQLIGGAGPAGVTYAVATALLGYTPDSLLDETVEGLAADDGATVFRVVDKVIDSGQDPRRFAEDLLRRLRDLVVVAAVPDAASRGLLEVADDQAARLAAQAGSFGRADLTRAADIVSQALVDMRGATAPRLMLEIMLSRILLPALDSTAEGVGARIDRLERRLSVATAAPAPPASQAPAPPASQAPAPPPGPVDPGDRPGAPTGDNAAPGAESAGPPGPVDESGLSLVDVRRLWPGVLDRVRSTRRFAWVQLSGNAQVKDVRDGVLTLAFSNAGACKNFRSSGNDELLRQALISELGVDWRVEAIIDGPGTATSAPASGHGAGAAPSAGDDGTSGSTGTATPAGPTDEPAAAEGDAGDRAPPSPGAAIPSPARTGRSSGKSAPGKAGPGKTGQAKDGAKGGRSAASAPPAESAEVRDDDPVVDDPEVDSQELLARELGAEVISDVRDDRQG